VRATVVLCCASVAVFNNMPRVLNVAEKPSVAKTVSQLLSNGQMSSVSPAKHAPAPSPVAHSLVC